MERAPSGNRAYQQSPILIAYSSLLAGGAAPCQIRVIMLTPHVLLGPEPLDVATVRLRSRPRPFATIAELEWPCSYAGGWRHPNVAVEANRRNMRTRFTAPLYAQAMPTSR